MNNQPFLRSPYLNKYYPSKKYSNPYCAYNNQTKYTNYSNLTTNKKQNEHKKISSKHNNSFPLNISNLFSNNKNNPIIEIFGFKLYFYYSSFIMKVLKMIFFSFF